MLNIQINFKPKYIFVIYRNHRSTSYRFKTKKEAKDFLFKIYDSIIFNQNFRFKSDFLIEPYLFQSESYLVLHYTIADLKYTDSYKIKREVNDYD